MKRVKHGCVFRLESGPRRGQLCKQLISHIGANTEYCNEHSMLISDRKARAWLASPYTNCAPLADCDEAIVVGGGR